MDRNLDVLIINNNYEEKLINTGAIMGFHRISRFKEVLDASDFVNSTKIISFIDIEEKIKQESEFLKKFDAIILSGSTLNVSELNKIETKTHSITNGGKIFHYIMNAISKYNRPVLAICFGMQLLAYHYDENSIIRPLDLPSSVKENHRIRKLSANREELVNDPLFQGFESLNVAFNHSDFIIPTKKLQKEITTLITNKHENFQWVHYFRHKNGIFFGIQFHPECNTLQKFKLDFYSKDEGTDFIQCIKDGETLLENFSIFASKT